MHLCKKKLLAILCLVAIMVFALPYRTPGADFSLHGFFQGNYSVNTASKNPDGEDFKWAEERLQLKLDGSRDPYYLSIKADAFYEHIDDEADVELREGYVDYISRKWDLRLGRQIITWGLGDLIFINDVFPKDYEAFFSGRPLEYLKKGVDSVKVGLYPSAANFEIVLLPLFEPNTFPKTGRFHNAVSVNAEDPAATLENTEASIRVYRKFGGLDASLYFYRGFYRAPAMFPSGGFFFPELSVYGTSIEGRALGGILGLEAGYYDSREDREGYDPSIPNSSTRALMTYKRQLLEDFTIGLQYFIDYMHRYFRYESTLPPGFTKVDRLYQLASIRLTRFLMHQNLRLSLFVFYSPSDGDYFANPELTYKLTDNVWAAAGGNVFGGNSGGQFGRFDRNDNIFTQMRYEF